MKPLLDNINRDDRYGVEYVNAVNGTKEIVESFLNKGQVGCWLSHVDMWTHIAEATNPYALVLEDDANIHLPEQLQSIYDVLADLPAGWDVCYLGGRYQHPETARNVGNLLETSASSVIWHSHAYLITKQAASDLFSQSRTFNASRNLSAFNDVRPVDDWMTSPERNINIYKVRTELIPFKYDGISDTAITTTTSA